MLLRIACAVIALGWIAAPVAAGIVDRAEATALKTASGKSLPRVMRDQDGEVTFLRLSKMQLTQADFQEIAQLEHLRALVLVETNVTDEDVAGLLRCKHLDHLNLTRTEVTDQVIESLLGIKTLKSVCLGDVRVTPAGIEKLRAENLQRNSRDRLRWGYSQRTDAGK